jgi:ureidoglycolate lyase
LIITRLRSEVGIWLYERQDLPSARAHKVTLLQQSQSRLAIFFLLCFLETGQGFLDFYMPTAYLLQVQLAGGRRTITATPLTATAFQAFGAVIENPCPDVHPNAFGEGLKGPRNRAPHDAISANQGSAIKYQHLTVPLNLYGEARSRRPGEEVVNMFVCAARSLEPDSPESAGQGVGSRAQSSAGLFPVRILERHPFTTQTFVPLGANPTRRYLVIVAPSLAPSEADANFPVPSSAKEGRADWQLPGRGLPDLTGLRAFIATGRQAITCKSLFCSLARRMASALTAWMATDGAGTWHAPMVALGEPGTSMDFVVVQAANGVALEDCQEVEIMPTSPHGASSWTDLWNRSSVAREGLYVQVPAFEDVGKRVGRTPRAKL